MIKHFGRIIIKHTSTTKTMLHIQKAEKYPVEGVLEGRGSSFPTTEPAKAGAVGPQGHPPIRSLHLRPPRPSASRKKPRVYVSSSLWTLQVRSRINSQ